MSKNTTTAASINPAYICDACGGISCAAYHNDRCCAKQLKCQQCGEIHYTEVEGCWRCGNRGFEDIFCLGTIVHCPNPEEQPEPD